MPSSYQTLSRKSNQALGIGQFSVDFVGGRFDPPAVAALAKLEQFHLDSLACAVSAIACGTRAPNVLRAEALRYPAGPELPRGATCFASQIGVAPEKAVLANCAAVREWDANGTNFGYHPGRDRAAGEFGHNDFYPVAIAAAQVAGGDGRRAALGMLLIDELRGRLAEVFSLKTHKIDHVLHGAIASAAAYGAICGATPQQIESALGLLVAHYVPFRAIRAGHQLSDSKGASAAISAEAAVVCMQRAIDGLIGPADIFRNPQALFCLFQPPDLPQTSPFDLTLTASGEDFAVMDMHFKLGMYEHQSAGAIQGLIDLLADCPQLLDSEHDVRKIRIAIYEPAYSIICDPAKRDPQTRQSADHSMVYIVATLLRKAFQLRVADWKSLMLMPQDYDKASLNDSRTRQLMEKIEVVHGGADYDRRYPDGIPTTVEIDHTECGHVSSGLVMYPAGHARNTTDDLTDLLDDKFQRLAALGVTDPDALRTRFSDLQSRSAEDIQTLYSFELLKGDCLND